MWKYAMFIAFSRTDCYYQSFCGQSNLRKLICNDVKLIWLYLRIFMITYTFVGSRQSIIWWTVTRVFESNKVSIFWETCLSLDCSVNKSVLVAFICWSEKYVLQILSYNHRNDRKVINELQHIYNCDAHLLHAHYILLHLQLLFTFS